MFPLVEFPELVEHTAPFFKEIFSAEAFIEFKRYISGLIVSENKTVDGIKGAVCHRKSPSELLEPVVDRQPVFVRSFEPSPAGSVAELARDADETQRGARASRTRC